MADNSLEIVDARLAPPRGKPCAACGFPVEPHDHFCPACGTPCPEAAPAPARQGGGGNQDGAMPQDGAISRVGAPRAPGGAAPPRPGPALALLDDGKHFRCEQCGAEVRADPDQRAHACPFCDSAYVVECAPSESGRQPPEFVIGFAVTPEEARAKFEHWLGRNNWFRPGDLKSGAVADKQRGVYLPFWTFSMRAESQWRVMIGVYWWRTETYTTRDEKGNLVTRTRQVQETEWRPLAGRHHGYYSGYLVSGSRGLPQSEALRVQPFNLPALKRYEPGYLAGWLCEEYSVGPDEALRMCQGEFQRRENASVAEFMPGDTHRDLEVRTAFLDVNSDLCLLPVYVLGYRYRGKLYRFLVNGQTGRVAGDKPWSGARIAAFVLALLLAAGAVALALALAAAFANAR